jgi:hypothetical protein
MGVPRSKELLSRAERMENRPIHRLARSVPPRRFTLRDAIVLVAATAVGFAWIRKNWGASINNFDGLGDWFDAASEMLMALLKCWTVAALGLRLLRPRPPLHRLLRQPGAAACGAATIVIGIDFVGFLIIYSARARSWPWPQFFMRIWEDYTSMQPDAEPFADSVAIAWALLGLSRRWRPEPSWIDRMGRGVGTLWIILFVWRLVLLAIFEWDQAQ